jgi:hypothetical protein
MDTTQIKSIMAATNMKEYDTDNDNTKLEKKETIPFWTKNPNILFQPQYILEFFPIEPMTYEQKLNAITRTVIILTIIGFAISQNFRLLIISAITIGAIYLIHYYHEKDNEKNESKKIVNQLKENFENPALDYLSQNNIPTSSTVFDTPTSTNPFSNVLMTDYEYNVDKKPAPPAFNANVNNSILDSAMTLVSEANPDQPDIADKLFKDLGEQFVFEQSLRPFSSNPNTTIPNDQQAFADFCYGSMVSCKEGNRFACARNLSRYTNV